MAEFFNERLPKDVTDLYLLGDWHVGDIFYAPDSLEKAVKYINGHPEGPMYLMGDLGRWFPVKDRLMSAEDFIKSAFPTPAAQIGEIERVLESIDRSPWDKIHIGNHEQHTFRHTGNLYTMDNLGPSLCDRLGLKYAGYTAFTHIKWEDGSDLRLLTTHGKKTVPYTNATRPGLTARYQANAPIALRDNLGNLDGGASDLYAMGHAHKLVVFEPPMVEQLRQLGDELETVHSREAYMTKSVWACCTGAFCKAFPKMMVSYQEEAMYGPSDIGFIHVDLSEKENGKRIPNIKVVSL